MCGHFLFVSPFFNDRKRGPVHARLNAGAHVGFPLLPLPCHNPLLKVTLRRLVASFLLVFFSFARLKFQSSVGSRDGFPPKILQA